MILHCDTDLEDSEHFFCMTLWLIMPHYHTKFGVKMICGRRYNLDKHTLTF